jgi:GDPmannose 4,6-dehydratase
VKHLIIGGSGQDGTLLSAQLLSQGQEVYSLSKNVGKLKGVTHITCEVSDTDNFTRFIKEVSPDRLYYLAAFHNSSENTKQFENLRSNFQINSDGFQYTLETLHEYRPQCQVVYASSCRVFGKRSDNKLTEDSPQNPFCAYGISKMMGMQIAKYYRNHKNMHVSSAILFNHESELRPQSFLSKKIILGALDARKNPKTKVRLLSINDVADWGHARDYIQGMLLMSNASQPDDYILSSGQLHTVGQFAQIAFECLGLDWKDYVEVELPGKTTPSWILCGSSDKIKKQLNWTPQYNFLTMIQDLIHRTDFYEKQLPTHFQFYL